ncbi:MAG: LytTR family DNA-binding domain-containing protein [Bacteroidetes bacterium]|nr:LytTR family DNA-binding domain-containing protein [Bacteroidota bacterium]
MKVVVVDDEAKIRKTIIDILNNYCPEVKSIDQAYDVASALDVINDVIPDVLILDISLGNETSFDLLKKIDHFDFKIIFVTAYEEYAIKAIKFSALDYLVKPINPKELIEAINNASKALERDQTELKLNALLTNIENISNGVRKIILKTSESIYMVNIQDIIRCESDDCYTKFYLTDGKKIMVSKTLREFDELLEEYAFFRSHQSHLINLYFIERFDKHDGGTIFMKDGSKIPVSSRKRNSLLKIFDKYSRM